ncbi:RNA recognition motif domain [Macleaya cordata]|uniref:RNA recognition motif domain n=1 Tax=Macleaya cordata TaxID=56857 RepID=A0A200Q4V6_MACCD|nr:RNA recognition motif domain [Macleaya cordata]
MFNQPFTIFINKFLESFNSNPLASKLVVHALILPILTQNLSAGLVEFKLETHHFAGGIGSWIQIVCASRSRWLGGLQVVCVRIDNQLRVKFVEFEFVEKLYTVADRSVEEVGKCSRMFRGFLHAWYTIANLTYALLQKAKTTSLFFKNSPLDLDSETRISASLHQPSAACLASMALLCPRFALLSIPPHRSSVTPNASVSETLIRRTVINRNASEISISTSVNRKHTVLPILPCSATSSSSVVPSNVDVDEKHSPLTRIFIKGLPQSTSEGFLVKTFSRFGKVNRVKIITDKKLRQSLGFGYVWFSSEESAQLAKKEMDGKVHIVFITVTIAKPEAPTSQESNKEPFPFDQSRDLDNLISNLAAWVGQKLVVVANWVMFKIMSVDGYQMAQKTVGDGFEDSKVSRRTSKGGPGDPYYNFLRTILTPRAVARMTTRDFVLEADDIEFGSFWWLTYAGISCFLVLFAGIMSGLTLGLMSLGLVELEILQRSGTSAEKKQAAVIFPVVQKQHQLLVTLLLGNACAMEALPIFLDKIFHPFVAVVLSVTFVLAFGEVIPQAICTRYGLAVGANFVWLVRILMIICYPIAYPIGKILDCVLGHNEALFRRAQLKALVSIHSLEAGKGGELTHDETTIISGALDLTEKTAEEAMTPIESTFSLDVNSKLDWEAIGKILARGHSRVPVYSGNPKNIIGLLLVKSLLTVRAETETPVSAVSIRRIPRVPADMPLYDILNEFQKGSSHMAAVVKAKGTSKIPGDGEKPNESKVFSGDLKLTTLLPKQDEESENTIIDIEKVPSSVNINRQVYFPQNDIPTNGLPRSSEDIEDGEVIGIITLEDVFEELLQEEIVDETDEYVDVHKRIRVAAAAAASSVARAPSTRRLITSQKAGGGQNKQGQTPKKSGDDDSTSTEQGNLAEPLLGKKR